MLKQASRAKLMSAAAVASLVLVAGCEAVPYSVWDMAHERATLAPAEPAGAITPDPGQADDPPAGDVEKAADAVVVPTARGLGGRSPGTFMAAVPPMARRRH